MGRRWGRWRVQVVESCSNTTINIPKKRISQWLTPKIFMLIGTGLKNSSGLISLDQFLQYLWRFWVLYPLGSTFACASLVMLPDSSWSGVISTFSCSRQPAPNCVLPGKETSPLSLGFTKDIVQASLALIYGHWFWPPTTVFWKEVGQMWQSTPCFTALWGNIYPHFSPIQDKI